MPELLLLACLMIPQFVAGVFAKHQGRSFWFWFFISFIIPVISLIILLFLEDKTEDTSYGLADHVKNRNSTP